MSPPSLKDVLHDPERENILWRKRGGTWKKLISGLDSTGTAEQFADRHRLFTTTACGSARSAPAAGCVAQRRQAAPDRVAVPARHSDTIHRWFNSRTDRCSRCSSGRGGLIRRRRTVNRPAAQPTAEVFQLDRPLIQTTGRKNLRHPPWKQPELSEWDGRRWIRIRFPDKVQIVGRMPHRHRRPQTASGSLTRATIQTRCCGPRSSSTRRTENSSAFPASVPPCNRRRQTRGHAPGRRLIARRRLCRRRPRQLRRPQPIRFVISTATNAFLANTIRS